MLLTIPAAADRASVSRRTIEREIAAGRLPVIPIRGAVRIDERDLEAYIQQSRTTRTPSCPSESAVIDGMSAFRSAAKESREVLDRLLRKRTPLTMSRVCDKT